MIANFLHCAIANPSSADSHLDYVNPTYSNVGETDSERLVRSILLGQANPPSESRFYTSVVLRRLIRKGPFSDIGKRFSLEGGWLLEDLNKVLFDSFKLVSDDEVSVSGTAYNFRLPVYALHRLVCQVTVDAVMVSNREYGIAHGVVGQPIRVPGMDSNATVIVNGESGQYTASWATRPSLSYGAIANTLATSGRSALLTIQTTPGIVSQDERDGLMRCITSGVVASDRVCAAALLLANAASNRLRLT